MASGTFQFVVELSLLEALRPELLMTFLEPYQRDLAGFGVAIGISEHSKAWLVRLHSVLNRDDAALPAPLQSALLDIADLSTDAGGEVLVAEAKRRGIELITAGALSRQDLAVRTYLAHPDLFRTAHSQLHLPRRTTVEDFYGMGSAGPVGRELEKQLKGLKKRLASAFRSRHRTGFCRVLLDHTDHELVLVVAHGRLPHRGAVIRNHRRRELRTYVVEAHDVIIYDSRADRLSIDAGSTDVDLYRAVMGYLFAMDDDYFRPYPTFRADPFKERGSAALDVRGIAGLDKVVLRAVTLLGRSRGQIVQALASEDLRSWLDDAFRTGTLQHLSFGAWTFGVFTPELELPLEVELRPPNQLCFDPRVPIGRFRVFLAAAGFEVVPFERPTRRT